MKVLKYLKKNGVVMDSKEELMQVHVEELGSRLTMDVRAGAQIMPAYVYNPVNPVLASEPIFSKVELPVIDTNANK